MGLHRIPYHLPLSAIRFSGTKTATTDALGGENATGLTTTSWTSTAELVTVADETYCAEVKTGWVFNSNVTLNFTDDARLTSADVDTSGAASTLVKGAVTAGVALVAATMGRAATPAAVAAAAAAARGVEFGADVADEEPSDEEADGEPQAPPEEEDPVAAAYEAAHPHEAKLRETLIEQVWGAEQALAEALVGLVADMSPEALKKHQAKHTAIDMARAELDRVQQHFAAWRRSKITSRSETHEQIVTLDVLTDSKAPEEATGNKASEETTGNKASEETTGNTAPDAPTGNKASEETTGNTAPDAPTGNTASIEDGTITWTGDVPDWATALWDGVGLLAIVKSPFETGQDGQGEPPATKSQPGVYVRHPRRVVIEVYRRKSEAAGDWTAELVSVDDHLVVDATSTTNLIRFRTSAWSKRKVTVTMSEAGFLTAYAHQTTASAKEIGETLGGLPTSVEEALGKASGIRDKLTALENKARDEAKADLDAEIALKEQEIVKAGLLATAADQIELERLTQQKALLDQQALVARAPAAADLAAIKQELELAQKKRELATEVELADVKMEIARLKAEVDLLAAGDET